MPLRSSRKLFDRLPSAMITPGACIRTRSVVLAVVPVVLAVVLAWIWYRSQRVLGLDAYYYVEYTKELAQAWPTVFGSNWPRGYPMLAAFLTKLGISPFMALVLISTASVAAMAVAAVNLLPRDLRSSWTAFAVLCALCSVPAVPLLVGMPMSELAFAALLLLSVYFVRHWPARWAVWLTLFLGFSAFCIRYAGIFMFGLIALFFVLHFDELRRRKALAFSGGWYTFFVGLTGFLLWSNIQATGHISGADRGFGGGLAVIPEQIAHLGWSAIGAVSSTQIDEMIGGVASLPGLAIGWAVMGLIAAICVRAAWSPREKMARPLALLVLSYLGAFVMMRALRYFPDINEPRYFVPVLFPLGVVVLLETRLQARRLLAAGAVAAMLLGASLSLRGVSEETYGDVSFARASLDGAIEPGDVVEVNAAALSLAAYYPNAFQWTRCGAFTGTADFVVVAGRRTGRLSRDASRGRGTTRGNRLDGTIDGGPDGALDDCGRLLAEEARDGGYVEWRRDGSSVVMRRGASVATSFSGAAEN
ncbi:MAG: hypothetical protein WD021_10330 [Rhodothermales bacterium]